MGRVRASGQAFPKLFAFFAQDSSSWKTSQPSEGVDSPEYSQTFPRSGMTRAGRAYELLTSVLPTQETDGSFSRSPRFPTPTLPTPTARDWKSGASNLHGTNSRPLNEVVLVLKTPTANLGRNGAPQHPDKRKGGGHGPTLDDELAFLVPYSDSIRRDGGCGDESEPEGWDEPSDGCHSPAEWWGDYLPRIRLWEQLLGRPAPAPTEIGPRGGVRLAAPFAEWLMGLPDGWVTAVPGLSRASQLKAIGNGVVPQQAYAAFKSLLEGQAK